jgi:hypothetical protein
VGIHSEVVAVEAVVVVAVAVAVAVEDLLW